MYEREQFKTIENKELYNMLAYNEKLENIQREYLIKKLLRDDNIIYELVEYCKLSEDEYMQIIEGTIDKMSNIEKDLTMNGSKNSIRKTTLEFIFKNIGYIEYAIKYITEKGIDNFSVNMSLFENLDKLEDKEKIDSVFDIYKYNYESVRHILHYNYRYKNILTEKFIREIYEIYKEEIFKEDKIIRKLFEYLELFKKYVENKYVIAVVDKICDTKETIYGDAILEEINSFNLTKEEIDLIEAKLIILKLA